PGGERRQLRIGKKRDATYGPFQRLERQSRRPGDPAASLDLPDAVGERPTRDRARAEERVARDGLATLDAFEEEGLLPGRAHPGEEHDRRQQVRGEDAGERDPRSQPRLRRE